MATPVLEIAAIVLGAALVAATLWSAMLTVVVPRAERPYITRYHFRLTGAIAEIVGRRLRDPLRRDRFESRIAPLSLVTLPFVWAMHILVGFSFIYWGLGVRSFIDALLLSGSSLTTLGIRSVEPPSQVVVVVIEALIGLGIVGLMISYLPTIYGAYTDREIAVARLEVRAGRPPHPVTFLDRSNQIGWLGELDTVWAEWEDWFLEIEETHTTHTSLSFFRSAYYGRSWLVAAGTILDAAALMQSTIEVESSALAALCLRSGFTTLGNIADALGVPHPIDPAFDDPISVDRVTFDALCLQLRVVGIPLKPDLDQAWIDFAGWRVNYDASLLGLFDTLRLDPGAWFGQHQVQPVEVS